MAYISQYLTDEQAKFVQKDYERSGESQLRFAWPVASGGQSLLRKGQFRFAAKELLGKRNAAAGRWKESKAPKNIGGRRTALGRRRSESQSRFA